MNLARVKGGSARLKELRKLSASVDMTSRKFLVSSTKLGERLEHAASLVHLLFGEDYGNIDFTPEQQKKIDKLLDSQYKLLQFCGQKLGVIDFELLRIIWEAKREALGRNPLLPESEEKI
jgi:hypothetical protein